MVKRAVIFFFVLFGCALHARAQGIYTTAIAIKQPGFLFPNGIDLQFFFEPGAPVGGFGYHMYSIDSSLKLDYGAATLGGVAATFSVARFGDVLDRDHVGSLINTLDGYPLSLDHTFLVGMHLVYAYSFPIIIAQERFGWARLKYTAAGLQILDQATALGGNGIIAGTTTVLPEPSTILLAAPAALALVWFRRRRSKLAAA